MISLQKALLLRFARGFVAGAVSSMLMINVTAVNTFTDLKVFLSALAISAIVGGVNGALLAMDKYFRSNELKAEKVAKKVSKKK
jgi:hypothetical protein